MENMNGDSHSVQHQSVPENLQADFDVIIEPGGNGAGYWRELWNYRGLFYFMAWRDILVRYKQTVFGISWCLIRPLVAMVVFSIVFGKIANLPSEGNAPYPVLVFVALLPWQLFSNALNETSNSLVTNANMLSKVYFPRLVIPASAVIVSLIDFLVSAVVLALMMVWYGFAPSWRLLTVPLFLMLLVTMTIGVGAWLAALNVRYRDFRHVVPFMVQFGMFVSPVGFSSSVIPEKWRLLYSLNPMVGVIDGFRWAILGDQTTMNWRAVIFAAVAASLLFALGIAYFRKTERTFADVI